MSLSELLLSSKHDNQTFVAYQVDFIRQLEQLPHQLSTEQIIHLLTHNTELHDFIADLDDSERKQRLSEYTRDYLHHGKLMASVIPVLKTLTTNA